MTPLRSSRAVGFCFITALALTAAWPISAQDLRGAPSSMPAGSALAPTSTMRSAMPALIDSELTGVGTVIPQPPPVAPPVQIGPKPPTSVRSAEWQLEQLWKKVDDLQRRLAVAEKRLAEHRHVYVSSHVNQLNYATVRHLLENAKERDGLLNFPGMPFQRETGLPVVPAASVAP